jgi:hypothetical protein
MGFELIILAPETDNALRWSKISTLASTRDSKIFPRLAFYYNLMHGIRDVSGCEMCREMYQVQVVWRWVECKHWTVVLLAEKARVKLCSVKSHQLSNVSHLQRMKLIGYLFGSVRGTLWGNRCPLQSYRFASLSQDTIHRSRKWLAIPLTSVP